jgi:hypothetical protein
VKVFDPVSKREQLEGDVGYRTVLDFDFEESRSVSGLASSAGAYLIDAIYCLLVGYDDPARQLLKRAFDWVTIAMKEREEPGDYAPDATEAERYETLAMCDWLLHGIHDAPSLSRFVEHEEHFLIREHLGGKRTEVSRISLSYLDAGAYQTALNRLASARFLAPKSLNAIRSEGQMCYVISRHQLGLGYSETEVASATEPDRSWCTAF